MKKRIMIMLFVMVFIISMMLNVCYAVEMNFPDVSESHWAYEHIWMAMRMGCIEGYPDGTFKPEQKVKTGEFIKMMAVKVNPNYKYVAPTNGEHWAKQYANLINGLVLNASLYDYDRLESVIPREEMAQLIFMYNITVQGIGNITEQDNKQVSITKMKDASIINADYRYAVNYCIEHGIINGFDDGEFKPKDGLTRAQAAKVMYLGTYN